MVLGKAALAREGRQISIRMMTRYLVELFMECDSAGMATLKEVVSSSGGCFSGLGVGLRFGCLFWGCSGLLL